MQYKRDRTDKTDRQKKTGPTFINAWTCEMRSSETLSAPDVRHWGNSRKYFFKNTPKKPLDITLKA